MRELCWHWCCIYKQIITLFIAKFITQKKNLDKSDFINNNPFNSGFYRIFSVGQVDSFFLIIIMMKLNVVRGGNDY